jgi:hypothetical protein
MKRQKQVFRTGEIAHLWANRKQESARNPSKNFYFEGDTIYSYGSHFPIARHINDKVIFFTTRSYSNTTSKHINHVKYAIPNNKIFLLVEDVRDTPKNFSHLEYYVRKMVEAEKKMQKSMTYGSIHQGQFHRFQNLFENYKKAFKFGAKELTNQVGKLAKSVDNPGEKLLERWKRAEERAKYRSEHREEIYKLREANAKHSEALRINEWRENTSISAHTYQPMFLRVNGDKIETIAGARVSLESAKILFKMIQEKRDIKGHNIEGYTVISLNGELHIGCHHIPLSEINRIAKQLNWIEENKL